jgi:hypothetical protein
MENDCGNEEIEKRGRKDTKCAPDIKALQLDATVLLFLPCMSEVMRKPEITKNARTALPGTEWKNQLHEGW